MSSHVGKPKCPNCGNETVVAFRPFCSHHCKSADLGRWFTEQYYVASISDAQSDDETS